VARHLHAQGINHGDLYAHNILHCGEGRAVLGDFGAASFHPPGDPGAAEALQRIEVRAFGCLLEELVERGADGPEGGPRRLWRAFRPAVSILIPAPARCLRSSNRPLAGLGRVREAAVLQWIRQRFQGRKALTEIERARMLIAAIDRGGIPLNPPGSTPSPGIWGWRCRGRHRWRRRWNGSGAACCGTGVGSLSAHC
jgi:serine/threonine protein kinase